LNVYGILQFKMSVK